MPNAPPLTSEEENVFSTVEHIKSSFLKNGKLVKGNWKEGEKVGGGGERGFG
jgi:hypothetical protein